MPSWRGRKREQNLFLLRYLDVQQLITAIFRFSDESQQSKTISPAQARLK